MSQDDPVGLRKVLLGQFTYQADRKVMDRKKDRQIDDR